MDDFNHIKIDNERTKNELNEKVNELHENIMEIAVLKGKEQANKNTLNRNREDIKIYISTISNAKKTIKEL